MHLKISSSASSTMAKCTLYCCRIEDLICDSNSELQFVSDDSHIEDKILITTFQQISEGWAKIHQFCAPTPRASHCAATHTGTECVFDQCFTHKL
jgi:hypothetical protein